MNLFLDELGEEFDFNDTYKTKNLTEFKPDET